MILSACVFAVSQSPVVYMWTDPSGQVHYSDTPSENVPTRLYNKSLNAPAPTTQLPAKNKKLPVTVDETVPAPIEQLDPKQEKALAAELTTLKKNCEASRSNLALLENTGRRVYRVSADGNYHYLNDQEREAEINRLNKQIKMYCTEK